MSTDTDSPPYLDAADALACVHLAVDRAQATRDWLSGLIRQDFRGRIALVSSFGAESAVPLHLIAQIDPSTPVIFLDTGKLFPETLAYRDGLVAHLGLTDTRTIRPAPSIAAFDPAGDLWDTDPDQCCWHRKVEPLDEALDGFAAWITGRKRFHGGQRTGLKLIEQEPGGRIKVNPLAGWSAQDILQYMGAHDLPRHPLVARGYGSIGCAPCTQSTAPGQSVRDGRWAGRTKTECGIHVARARA